MAGSLWYTFPRCLTFSIFSSALFAAENGFRTGYFEQRKVKIVCHDSQIGVQVSSSLACAAYCLGQPGCIRSSFELETHACISLSRKPSARRNCSVDGTFTYLLSSGRTTQKACASGMEYTYEPNSGLCYKHYKSPLSWDQAQERCYKDGGDLVQGDTQDKMDHLQVITSDEGLATFIGAFKLGSTCWWVDMSEADNVNCERCRSCLMIQKEGDRGCEECGKPLSFICELK